LLRYENDIGGDLPNDYRAGMGMILVIAKYSAMPLLVLLGWRILLQRRESKLRREARARHDAAARANDAARLARRRDEGHV